MRVPVENHVHVQFGTPAHGLVEQLDVFRRRPLPPCDRMDGDADQLRAHLLDLDEMLLAPMPLHFELVRIRNRQSAEQHRVPVRVHEFVSLDRDQRHLLVVQPCRAAGPERRPATTRGVSLSTLVGADGAGGLVFWAKAMV